MNRGTQVPTIPSLELTAWQAYADKRLNFLNSLGRSRSCRDPLAEFSEHLVHRLLGGTMAASRVQKGYDLIRPDGRRVQVKYLANPGTRWVNEHLVRFVPETEDYALVFFEAMQLTVVVVFPRETIASVCAELGKRHPNQDHTLQLTRRNLLTILEDEGRFRRLEVEVYRP